MLPLTPSPGGARGAKAGRLHPWLYRKQDLELAESGVQGTALTDQF